MRVYSTDYPPADGTTVRDFVHIEAIAQVYLLAFDIAAPGEHWIYNLGNGAGFSVRQVVEAARRITGKA